MGKMKNRIKTWWMTATTGEKVNTILGVIGAGTSLYCARKMSKAKQSVDISKITLTMRGETELMKMLEARRLTIDTPDMEATVAIRKDPDTLTPLTGEEARRVAEDCAD